MDSAYAHASRAVPLLPHHYGEQVHLVQDVVLLRQLAVLSSPSCRLPEMARSLRELYASLLRYVLLAEWPREQACVPSRMHAQAQDAAIWRGEQVADAPKTVVVDIARAGTLPAQECFEALLRLFGPSAARQDHLSMARTQGEGPGVSGAELHVGKVGGPSDGCYLLLPDPMGATGTSMAKAINFYKARPEGRPARIFALHLIVTPEYLAHMHEQHSDVSVWALRLDRGLSAPDVLARPLGERWREERGLNEHAYIVPGAGGIGELLNNAEH